MITGYQYGLSNNLFHIPYVLRLAEQPEFQNDVLYNSLVNYTSIIWPVLRAISTEQNIQSVFFTAFVVTRFLTFYAMYVFIAEQTRSDSKTLSICVALSVTTACSWAVGVSIIGGHGIMINYFTQTEATWPFIFIALLYLKRHKFAKTGLAIGAIFAINAFVGLWLVWTALFTKIFANIAVSWQNLIRGTLAFLLIAGPVMIWVFSTGNIERSDASFSYVEYARIYNPYHYLIEVSSVRVVLQFLLLFIAGVLACQHVSGSKYWIGVQASLLLLFIIGAALPYILDNKFVIILHFLRSDGVEQFLAVLLICTAAANVLFSVDFQHKNKALAMFILTLLIAPYPTHSNLDLAFIVLALLLMRYSISSIFVFEPNNKNPVNVAIFYLARSHIEILFGLWSIATIASVGLTSVGAGKIAILGFSLAFFNIRFMMLHWRGARTLVLSMMIALCGWSALLASESVRQFVYDENSTRSRSFKQMTDWVRKSSFHGPFLIKAGDWGDSFQLLARRTVWVDWKQGGAIPWAPQFYQQWSSRYAEVSQLHTPEDFLSYAKKNGIENVILDSEGAKCPSDATAEQQFGSFTFCHLPLKNISSFGNPKNGANN